LETGGAGAVAASAAAEVGAGISALFAARPAAKYAMHAANAAIQPNDQTLQMRAITIGTRKHNKSSNFDQSHHIDGCGARASAVERARQCLRWVTSVV
jgi:ornithine cyclodeaminase/alanine dehydrogenase-like protein (mu-crystallin family)